MEDGMTVVDKLLEKAIEDTIAHIAVLEADIEQSKLHVVHQRNTLADYKKAYQDTCPHELSVRETVSYMEGGYDHVSETQYRDVCTRCGKVTGSKLVRGTYA